MDVHLVEAQLPGGILAWADRRRRQAVMYVHPDLASGGALSAAGRHLVQESLDASVGVGWRLGGGVPEFALPGPPLSWEK
ncbi:hypothetical protein ACFYNV_22325 [Streptomyces albidoflavus]